MGAFFGTISKAALGVEQRYAVDFGNRKFGAPAVDSGHFEKSGSTPSCPRQIIALHRAGILSCSLRIPRAVNAELRYTVALSHRLSSIFCFLDFD